MFKQVLNILYAIGFLGVLTGPFLMLLCVYAPYNVQLLSLAYTFASLGILGIARVLDKSW
jgi:hypothetical protein